MPRSSNYHRDPTSGKEYLIPEYWDASKIPSAPNVDNSYRIARRSNILQDYESIRTSSYSFRKGLLDDMLLAKMTYQKTIDISHLVVKLDVIEATSGAGFYLINDNFVNCFLKRFNLCLNCAKGVANFEVYSESSRSIQEPSNQCSCAVLHDSDNRLLTMSVDRLRLIEFDEETRTFKRLMQQSLLRPCRASRFAQRVAHFPSDAHFFSRPHFLFYNASTLSVFADGSRQLAFSRLKGTPLQNGIRTHGFGAVASAPSERGRALAYVGCQNFFCLLQVSSPGREKALVAFKGQGEVINHLQCISTPSGERGGVVVGRMDGSVELWEDRQPSKPSVVYTKPVSGDVVNLTPPVVDASSRDYLASRLPGQQRIGIWKVQTGELLNILDYEQVGDFTAPKLHLRSCWDNEEVVCGPTLLAFQGNQLHFFY